MTLTGHLIASAAVENSEIVRLAREDQIHFAEAPINQPKPNKRLTCAARNHAEPIERR